MVARRHPMSYALSCTDAFVVAFDCCAGDVLQNSIIVWSAAAVTHPALWAEFAGATPASAAALLQLLAVNTGVGAGRVRKSYDALFTSATFPSPIRLSCWIFTRCVCQCEPFPTTGTPTQVRVTVRGCLHALCSLTDPACATATVVSTGAPHPHAFVLATLLSHLVVAPNDARPMSPRTSPLAGDTTECYTLASLLLAEACAGRCGASPLQFRDALKVLLLFVQSSPIVEAKASGPIDRDLAGSMELASVLVRAVDVRARAVICCSVTAGWVW